MSEAIQYQDYIGFTFNGRHSSSLGIMRTSNGSRFEEGLLPTIQDKTLQVPGGDGTYFFGSYYTQKTFNIPFAFDGLTEQQFSELKEWLGDKQIHELTFDELPYKAYQAKITGSATIKHIPFETNNDRIYKGEGSIQFTAYYPYAKSRFKFLSESNASNKSEWREACGMKESNPENGLVYDTLIGNSINLYNPGDLDTNFQLRLAFGESNIIPQFGLQLDKDLYPAHLIKFSAMARQEGDAYIQIDTKLNLVEGLDKDLKKTGNIYNKHMVAGQFFKIPKSKKPTILQFVFMKTKTNISDYNPQIFYDFYYF